MCDRQIRKQIPQRMLQKSQQEIQLLQNSWRPERVFMQQIGDIQQQQYSKVAIDSIPQNYLSLIETKLSQLKLINDDKQINQGIYRLRNLIQNRNQLKSLVSRKRYRNKHKQYCFKTIMGNTCNIFIIIMVMVTFILFILSTFIFIYKSQQTFVAYQCHVHLKFIDQARQMSLNKYQTIDEKYNDIYIRFKTPLIAKKTIRLYTDSDIFLYIWLIFKRLAIGCYVFSFLGSFSMGIKDCFKTDEAKEQKKIKSLGGRLQVLPRVSSINPKSILNMRNDYDLY